MRGPGRIARGICGLLALGTPIVFARVDRWASAAIEAGVREAER